MLKAKVASVGQGEAVIQLDNDQSFKINTDNLSEILRRPGQELFVSFTPVGEAAEGEQAKNLLNYLLRVS